MDPMYALSGGVENDPYDGYGYESSGRGGVSPSGPPHNGTSGSTALYHHNGSRYGLGNPGRGHAGGAEAKMNGLHGPKHKRGDIDRECM
jgi:hypothetical protein